MALAAAKNIEDDDYSDCWDLLAPQPPDPEPPKTKAPNIYKVTDAHVNIGGHPADSYTYPLAITDRTPRLLDRSVMIDGIEYQVVDVQHDRRASMDFGHVSRGGAGHGDEITIRARRI